jgi:hypothetical protein
MKKLCFISILALAGCQFPQVVDYTGAHLITSGPVEINVRSFSGNVTVIADPTVIGTIISAQQIERGDNETPIAEPKIECTTEIKTSETGQIVLVNAMCDDNALQLIHADIVIRAASIHNVTVETTNGNVTLLGISGAISIRTNDGDVRVVTLRVINEPVTIENRRGDIIYRVRGESSGMIDATAINGKASLDLRQGEATILEGSTGDHLVANFNGGIHPLAMRTVDGDIRIAVVADPVGSEPLFNTDWISW